MPKETPVTRPLQIRDEHLQLMGLSAAAASDERAGLSVAALSPKTVSEEPDRFGDLGGTAIAQWRVSQR